jgi:hypothetical protein
MKRSRRAQAGMALVVGLIMLALMTLIAIATYNMGRTGMDIIGNMQRRQEVTVSANSVIEAALSTKRMFQTPNAIFQNPCNGANTQCFDLNGDGVNDVQVTLTPAPSCLQQQPIANASLNLALTEDQGCIKGSPELWAIEGIPGGNSLCANTLWELNAIATDTVTSANITVTEGAAIRVSTDDVSTNCP